MLNIPRMPRRAAASLLMLALLGAGGAAAAPAAGAMPIRLADSRAGLPLSRAAAGTWYGITAGKIRPAGQVRQRLPSSQAASCCCCPRLNVRGRMCSTTEPADALRPISTSTKPARTSR